MTPLRFAPLIRVSTETQKKKGESLRVQREQIIKYVGLIEGGEIPPSCWKYTGQEHATPEHERRLLDKLLEDSSKGIFDAVIVVDPSRWSRDNEKSKAGLRTLRDNNIRFFIGTREYDLWDHNDEFYLGLYTEMNERQAKDQNQKSVLSKIAKAEEGIPTNGRLPYGRTFDRKTKKWGIDREKKGKIVQAAERYLRGEPIPKIARTIGISETQLRDTLNGRCGTTWEFSLKVREKAKVITKTFTVKVPRLLEDNVIEAIRERARNNISANRGNRKYEYLLTGFVFCSRCGYHMGTRTNNERRQYYRHSQANNDRCSMNKHIPARELESSVLITLIKHFGDPDLIEEAIKKATPNVARVEALMKEKEQLLVESTKIGQRLERLVEAVGAGSLSGDDIKEKSQEIKNTKKDVKDRLSVIEEELSYTPDPEKIRKYSYLGVAMIDSLTRYSPKLILKRGFHWRRKLVERAFFGVDATGKHHGVYVDFIDGKTVYEIRGQFENTIGSLPLDDMELIEAFHIDTEFQDVEGVMKEIQSIRDSIIKTGFS